MGRASNRRRKDRGVRESEERLKGQGGWRGKERRGKRPNLNLHVAECAGAS